MTSSRGQYTGTQITRKDRTGIWTIGHRLGSGNEGEVYAIQNDPAYAAKIYHEGKRPGPTQTTKLMAMEGKPPPGPLESTGFPTLTWPQQLIQDNATSTLVGFIMPRLSTDHFVPIGTYCNPEARKRSVPVRYHSDQHVSTVSKTAIKNFTQTVHRLHLVDALIGDINDNNILINPADGFIAVIDCDSFQYTDQATGKTFPCTVGRPEYTAPELMNQMSGQCNEPQCSTDSNPHRASYGCIPRTRDHDLFAVAVVIFKLLMDGSHPYDCIVSGPNAHQTNSLKDRIESRYFAYGPRKAAHIRPASQNQKRYERIPPTFRALFERAFA